MRAYCWQNGVIGFGARVPEGAICFAKGKGRKFREFIEVKARLAYDNKTWLVPGIPEAEGDKKLDALYEWIMWLKKSLSLEVAHLNIEFMATGE